MQENGALMRLVRDVFQIPGTDLTVRGEAVMREELLFGKTSLSNNDGFTVQMYPEPGSFNHPHFHAGHTPTGFEPENMKGEIVFREHSKAYKAFRNHQREELKRLNGNQGRGVNLHVIYNGQDLTISTESWEAGGNGIWKFSLF